MSALLENETEDTTTQLNLHLVLETEVTETGHCVLTEESENKLIAFLAKDDNGKIIDPYNADGTMAFDHHSSDFRSTMRLIGTHEKVSHVQYLDKVAGMARATQGSALEKLITGINSETISELCTVLMKDDTFKAMLAAGQSSQVTSFDDGVVERIVTAVKASILTSSNDGDAADFDSDNVPGETSNEPESEGAGDVLADFVDTGNETETDEQKPAVTAQSTGGNAPLRRRSGNH